MATTPLELFLSTPHQVQLFLGTPETSEQSERTTNATGRVETKPAGLKLRVETILRAFLET